jgi:hypothetical protein
MLSVFGASLSFEEMDRVCEEESNEGEGKRGCDDWLLQRKIKLPQRDEWDEGELGDSCCFGTRTIESSIDMDCVWKLHGGI